MNPIHCFLALLTCLSVTGQKNDVRRLRRMQATTPEDGQVSGTRCIINPAGATSGCSSGQFCQKDIGECRTKNFGLCQPQPEVCPMMYMPVCGCDGQTYGNSCTASVAGTSVSYSGECIIPEDVGITGSMSMSTPIFEAEMSMGSMSKVYEDAPNPQSVLIGTSWTAEEVAIDVNITSPITLNFDLEYDMLYGSTGCNNYRGGLFNWTNDSFITDGQFSTTRMYCVGLMEQESAYLGFLKNKTFFYQIIDEVELVLFDQLSGEGGTILARFTNETAKEPL